MHRITDPIGSYRDRRDAGAYIKKRKGKRKTTHMRQHRHSVAKQRDPSPVNTRSADKRRKRLSPRRKGGRSPPRLNKKGRLVRLSRRGQNGSFVTLSWSDVVKIANKVNRTGNVFYSHAEMGDFDRDIQIDGRGHIFDVLKSSTVPLDL